MKNTAWGPTLWEVPGRTVPADGGTQTVRVHVIPSRPHVQGSSTPLRLRHSAGKLTDGGGLVFLRRAWDALAVGAWIDGRTAAIRGRYRPSLLIELWVALLFYGGSRMDDLARVGSRGIRRIFGWRAVPDPTTFGRWLRRGGAAMAGLLDELVWPLVRLRWEAAGVPSAVTLLLDSHVAVRYGTKQAGAEKGYNPKKPGRPSHHPFVAFLQETGDCLGVRWRPGSAGPATGASEWITKLVGQLRAAGVQEITVRLDKGFFSQEMVETLLELDIRFYLKVPDWDWVRGRLSRARRSKKNPSRWTRSGTLYGARLLSVEDRRPLGAEDGGLELGSAAYELKGRAHVLTNVEDIYALTAWRRYNAGAVVEDRIKKLVQLGAGRTAVDDTDGNRVLWQLAAVAYALLHVIRTTALEGGWRRAEPERLRSWLFRLPAKLTTRSRKHYIQLRRKETVRQTLLRAFRALAKLHGLRAPPAAA